MGERQAEDEAPKAKAAPVEQDALEVPRLPEPAHVESPDLRCVGAFTGGKIAPLDVDTRATTATVSWYYPGDPTMRPTASPASPRTS
ncbi:hypothetical protein [Actinoplanes sp. NPDC026619]|uniref:hypothetical protein n=1 Tax=Actinoplanes sp. NPDC026619 TaxID=3155798 RepID=UPI0033E8C864